ncbi:MAG: hypothetical protein ACRD3I_10480, partial [Terriglobales bacterium]
VCLVAAVCWLGVEAQEAGPKAAGRSETAAVSSEVSVLRLVKFSGVIRDGMGQPRTGVVGLTFAIYKEQEGGAPLWLETQNVQLDEQGRYAVLLGAESSEGLPLEIFSSTEARWLGVQLQGEEEQPRVLLVSVPYALKAADADTLGGKPASAFVVAESTGERSATTADTTQAVTGTGTTALTVNPGNVGDIVKYTGSPDTLGPATNFVESGGNVGVGTTAPGARLESRVTSGGEIPLRLNTNFGGGNAVDFYPYIPGISNDGFQLSLGGTGRFWITSGGNVGIGTSNPGAKLEVAGQVKITGGTPGLGRLLTTDNSGLATWQSLAQLGGVAGQGEPTRVAFWEDTVALSSNANLIWDNTNSRLGIGESSPLAKLDIFTISGIGLSVVSNSGTAAIFTGNGGPAAAFL